METIRRYAPVSDVKDVFFLKYFRSFCVLRSVLVTFKVFREVPLFWGFFGVFGRVSAGVLSFSKFPKHLKTLG